MISPDDLLPMWEAHRAALEHPIRTIEFADLGRVFDDRPYQLGVINLSRDSSYRESIAHGVDASLYRARKMTIEGAAMIDVGAESTGTNAELLDVDAQLATLLPAVEALVADGHLVSVETYHTDVAVASLAAGARVVNLTGRVDDPALYEAIARHDAGLILCYTPGETARSDADVPPIETMIDEQLAFFRQRLDMVTGCGVDKLWIDPGFGFALNLPDGPERVRYQTANVLQAFRFREFGWPVCVTMASSVYLFHDEVRSAETGMAVLALLAKANLLRTHEVARVQPILDMLEMCGPSPTRSR
jgi:dihydropteroate synthase